MENIRWQLTRPIGPLPAFAWVIVIVGAYLVYRFIRNRSDGGIGAANAGTTAGTTLSAADMATLQSILSGGYSNPNNPNNSGGGTGGGGGNPNPVNTLSFEQAWSQVSGKFVSPSTPGYPAFKAYWKNIFDTQGYDEYISQMTDYIARNGDVPGVPKTNIPSVPVNTSGSNNAILPEAATYGGLNTAVSNPFSAPNYNSPRRIHIPTDSLPNIPSFPTVSQQHIPTRPVMLPPVQTPRYLQSEQRNLLAEYQKKLRENAGDLPYKPTWPISNGPEAHIQSIQPVTDKLSPSGPPARAN